MTLSIAGQEVPSGYDTPATGQPAPYKNPTVIGGGIVTPSTPAPTPTPTPAPAAGIPNHIEIVPGGRSLVRDTTNWTTTGQPPKLRVMDYVQNTIGKDVHHYEWPRYTWVISYANDLTDGTPTEHVADTVRFDKNGDAAAWNRVTESTDNNGRGAFVQHERNCRVTKLVSDELAQDNGSRFCEDVIVAGSAEKQDPVRELGWTAYLRLRGGNPLAYFSFGFILGAIRDTGVQVTSWIRGGVRAFEALGVWSVGLDLSQAHFKADAIRLAPGQKVSFEPTGCRALSYRAYTGDGKGDRLQYLVNDRPVFEVDTNGNLYITGKVFQQAQL